MSYVKAVVETRSSRSWLRWLAFFAALMVCPAMAQSESSGLEHPVSHGRVWTTLTRTLAGIPLLIVRDDQAETFDLGVRIEAGYNQDPAEVDGLAHLAEHLIAHGAQPVFGQSLKRWCAADQHRYLHFHTSARSTEFHFASDVDDALSLLDRFDAAITRSDYSADDVAQQLDEIARDQKAISQDPERALENAFATMARRGNPFSRVMTSGGDRDLRAIPLEQLTAQANAFLRSNYTGNASALVVISPLDPEQARTLLQSHLKAMFSQPRAAMRPLPSSIEIFAPEARASWKEITYEGHVTKLETLYPLPWTRHRRGGETVDLLDLALNGNPRDSLASRLEAKGFASKTTVSLNREEFDGADDLDIEVELTGFGAAHLADVLAAQKHAIHDLLSVTRDDLAARLAATVGARTLFDPLPARSPLVFRLLQQEAIEATANPFNYQVEPDAADWSEFVHVRDDLDNGPAATVIAKPAKRTDAVTPARMPAKRKTAPVLISTRLPSVQALANVAACLRNASMNQRECLAPYWGIEAKRGAAPLLDGLERAISDALLDQTAAVMARRFDAGGISIRTLAETAPAVEVIGDGLDRKRALEAIWSEFLRPRNDAELTDLLERLHRHPREAYLEAESQTDDLDHMTDLGAINQLRSVVELKRQVGSIQARYRFGESEAWPTSIHGAAATAALRRPSEVLHREVGGDFRVTNLQVVRCTPMTPFLQSATVLVMPMAHRLVWSEIQQKATPKAFGAYRFYRSADQYCYGTSEDSSVMTADALRASSEALQGEVAQKICDADSATWNQWKARATSVEATPWSRSQADQIRDVQNWMHGADSLISEDTARARIADLDQLQVCEWMRNKSSADHSHDQRFEVLVKSSDEK